MKKERSQRVLVEVVNVYFLKNSVVVKATD